MLSKNGFVTMTSVLALTAFAGEAAAQQMALEEIVVTARKRSESLQDVPLSITAFTAEALERRLITELDDIALLTPGFTFEDFAGSGFGVPVVRGATQQDITVLEQNVSIFLDGVYIPRSYAFDLGSVGMERIEIVKGPQSALYGQNAFMGAVNYVSTKATADDFSADAKATVGTDNLYEASGSVNIPIAADRAAIRLSGSYSEFDGTWNNNHPNKDLKVPAGTTGNVRGWERYSLGAQIYLNPTEGLDINASYRRFDSENESSAVNRINPAFGGAIPIAPNCGALNASGAPTLFCGELPGVTERNLVVDPRGGGTQSETDFFAASVDYDFSEAVTVSYSYGNIQGEGLQISTLSENTLLTPGAEVNFQAVPNGSFKYWQHEARVSYDAGEALRASFGGFISEVKDEDKFSAYVDFLAPFFGGGPIPALGTAPVTLDDLTFTVTDANAVVESKSIFGLISYGFLEDRARISVEGRYTDEDKTITNNASGLVESTGDKFFAPRVTFDYQYTGDNLFYALAAKGTKSGGLNADPGAYAPVGLIPSEKTFGPDENWTYEIGSKNTLLDGRMTLNAALFYVDWSNMQISAASTVPPGITLALNAPTILLNIGDASIKGFEVDGSYRPTDQLSLTYGASYQDAEFADGVQSQRLQSRGFCDGVTCPLDYAIGGNTLPRSASTQMFGGFSWQDELGALNDADYFIQADVAWQNKMYVDELNLAWIPSRTVVNASIGLDTDQWRLSLWSKNLLNKEYVTNAFFITFGAEYVPTMAQKRTIGLSLAAKF